MSPPLKRSLSREEKQKKGREAAFQFLARDLERFILIGPVSMWLGSGFGLAATEELLDSFVAEGILRRATEAELKTAGFATPHAYRLTEAGLERLSRWKKV